MSAPKMSPQDLRRFLGRGRNKYGVASKERRTADGIVFASRREMNRYIDLKLAASSGQCWFLRQVPFHLPGGVVYRADFVVFYPVRNRDGTVSWHQVVVEDVKGFRTPAYRRAKKQVEALYPVRIVEVR